MKYHIVWITTYRNPIVRGEIAEHLRDLIRETCKTNDVEIIKGHISNDHLHLFVSASPHFSLSQLVTSIKGKSSRKLMIEYKQLSKAFWGRHIWARGYFVASSGNLTDEVIIKYIKNKVQNL